MSEETANIFKNLVSERKVEQLVELLKTITFEKQVLEDAFCLSAKNGRLPTDLYDTFCFVVAPSFILLPIFTIIIYLWSLYF